MNISNISSDQITSYHVSSNCNFQSPVIEQDVSSWISRCCSFRFQLSPDIREFRGRDLFHMKEELGEVDADIGVLHMGWEACNYTFQYLGPRFEMWFTRVFRLYFGPFISYWLEKQGSQNELEAWKNMKKVLLRFFLKLPRWLREGNVLISRDYWNMNYRMIFSFDVNVATSWSGQDSRWHTFEHTDKSQVSSILNTALIWKI